MNDDLMVLEAMKMRNVLKAPIDGVIKAIHVKEGQAVPKDFVLIEFK
jgi:biotin carboxyl carrier protein